MKTEGLIDSIRQRLLNLSRENGEAFDFVLARYGVERFLYRLSASDHADHFVLKGSMLFHVWNRKMHRPTRDLDLLGSGVADQESIRLDVQNTRMKDFFDLDLLLKSYPPARVILWNAIRATF